MKQRHHIWRLYVFRYFLEIELDTTVQCQTLV
jgi:hypothetical protein